MKVHLEGLPLTEEDVKTCDEVVRDVAKWNRNAFAHREVLVITSDVEHIRSLRVRVPKDYRKALGWCWYVGADQGKELKAIWVRNGQDRVDSLITVVHELCHAYAGTTISHEESFRRFCVIATVALAEQEDAFKEDEFKPLEWADNLCVGYQRRSHMNPYEADRHMLAFQKYMARGE
jgi:hypothetical protein